jgi:adenosine deaminase
MKREKRRSQTTPGLFEALPPLADLHRHLDGSLRPDTLAELARRAGRKVPDDLYFHEGMGLNEALARFRFTLSLLDTPDTVKRVAAEICDDAAAEGVATLELRFAPHLHGGRMEAFIDAALEGIDGRAGLILCGLYGEPPSVFNRLVETARNRPEIAGIDLAGGPVSSGCLLSDYVGAFDRAYDMGLGITVHAGEGRPASEIRDAVEKLHAKRIGHGVTLFEDPSVAELVIEREVTIEACVTSNLHTGVIERLDAHPLPTWLDRGVRACICTDNTLLSRVDAMTEHRRVAAIDGMDDRKLLRAIEHGHQAAFSRPA